MSLSRTVGWVLGDLFIFLLFSASGRYFHGLSLDISAILFTAFPYILCWFIISPFLGLFKPRHYLQILWRTCLAVFLTTTIGTWLRAILINHHFDWLFYQVTLVFFLVVFLVWRSISYLISKQSLNRTS
ncbi:DUF3054 domain-containing protein [Thermoflavimicrobium daqui]|nr:DUF3054 domain-containing protein [Thermoflavimicrobium daqui]